MSDPTPAVVDAEPADAPAPAPAPASATVLPALIEAYPACFDWEHPRPLKIGLHRDLLAAGLGEARVKGADLQRALARYCHRPLYRWTLRAGATRVDLHGQPAGVVTAAEAKTARAAWKARQTGRPVPPRPGDAPSSPKEVHPPNATPLPKESLVPGRLELTVKFSELPRPRSVQNGFKMGIQTGEGIVTTILPAKVWRTLERATQTYPQWVAALSGALERFADGEIALKHPAVQVFEKKAKPAAAPEGKASEPNGPEVKAPEGKAPEGKALAPKAPDGQAAKLPSTTETPKGAVAPHAAPPLPTHLRATISLKGRATP
jgi:hypothetical protein